MPVSLTQPNEGSVGWAAAVNQNFQDIEDALTTVGGTFADGVTCLSAQAQTVGTSLSKTIAAGVLANDGEALRVTSSVDNNALTGTINITVFGTVVFTITPAVVPDVTLKFHITRESSSSVRVVIDAAASTTETTVAAVSGTITVAVTSGVVRDLKVELLSQSPYSGSNVLVPVAPGTVAPGVATMPLSGALTYGGSNASSSRVAALTSTVDEAVIASTVTLAGNTNGGGCNAKVWHSDGYQYALARTATTTAGLYRRANGSTTWSVVGSTWTVSDAPLCGVYSVGGKVVVIYVVSSSLRAAAWDGSTLSHHASGVNATPRVATPHLNTVWVAAGTNNYYAFDASTLTWALNGAPGGTAWGGVCSHFGQLLVVTSSGVYRHVSGTTWSQVGAHAATASTSATYIQDIVSVDTDTVVFGMLLNASSTTRLYSMTLSTGATTLLPSPAGWSSAQVASWFVVDDVSDPAVPTINCYHCSTNTGTLGYFQVALSGTVTSTATGFTIATTAIPAGRLSHGRVEPRTSDVVAAAAVTLTPCSPPVSGRMLLTLSIEDGGSGDTFTTELWVPGASGGRARATLVGTATGGTRSGSQVTGVADGTPMTVEWDCAADGFADSTVLHPAPFVRLYREP